MLIEKVLQLLVGHVDAQLLKAVDGKVLKAKNVEDANLKQLSPLTGSQAWVRGRDAMRTFNLALVIPGDSSSLTWLTIQLKRRPYSALAKASRQSRAWWRGNGVAAHPI